MSDTKAPQDSTIDLVRNLCATIREHSIDEAKFLLQAYHSVNRGSAEGLEYIKELLNHYDLVGGMIDNIDFLIRYADESLDERHHQYLHSNLSTYIKQVPKMGHDNYARLTLDNKHLPDQIMDHVGLLHSLNGVLNQVVLTLTRRLSEEANEPA